MSGRLKTLKSKIAYRIERSKDSVFIIQDFSDLSDSDQIGRALRDLMKEEKIVRLGQGVYGKLRYSDIVKDIIPDKPVPSLVRDAMKKLGTTPYPSSADQAYNKGQSTQVPSGRVIGIKKRFSRKLGYDRWQAQYERV